ncbi:MAG: type II secretion system protein [Campylobacteraceae bacterium]|nr:type II secretion system protein [Campylobacteraceae bacterium]
MKKGFSLLTAIIFIVTVATIGALSLSMSNVTAKQTGDLYLRTQAELLAQSATGLALMGITAHDINGTNCLNQINGTFPDTTNPVFDISVTISYLGREIPAGCNIVSNTVQNNESNLTVIVDTVVSSHGDIATEPIRFYKRTIQKP